MSDISEAWTCPLCNATWTRERGEGLVEWAQRLIRVQLAHGVDCSRLPQGLYR